MTSQLTLNTKPKLNLSLIMNDWGFDQWEMSLKTEPPVFKRFKELQPREIHKRFKMQKYHDWTFDIDVCMAACGNLTFKAPPLINTSLSDMAVSGWKLFVSSLYVRGMNHTRLKYHFRDSEGKSSTFLTFKVWTPGAVVNSDKVLELLKTEKFIPSLSRQCVTRLPTLKFPTKDEKDQAIEDFVLDELAVLKKINDLRELTLPKEEKKQIVNPEPTEIESIMTENVVDLSQYVYSNIRSEVEAEFGGEVFDSQERLVG